MCFGHHRDSGLSRMKNHLSFILVEEIKYLVDACELNLVEGSVGEMVL